tara:strand:+ start:252 stop:473 length:222 start_codon:yes stop_codon:yes gene_type:complete
MLEEDIVNVLWDEGPNQHISLETLKILKNPNLKNLKKKEEINPLILLNIGKDCGVLHCCNVHHLDNDHRFPPI